VIIHVLGEPAAAMATATASTACVSATAAKAKEVDYVTVIMFTPKTGATLYNIIHAAASQFTFFYITISSFANSGEK
jgi:hypothetical protein